MSKSMRFVGPLGLLLAACATSDLAPLVLDGPELHATLATRAVVSVSGRRVPDPVRGNPQLSSEPEFVRAVTRYASQGALEDDEIRTALHAIYRGETELGIYGLDAATTADADRLENRLRTIWSHNVALDRARVHRGGTVLIVVWHDGVSATCWEAANASVVARLPAP